MGDQIKQTRVIAIGNQKGGVGKTTNAVHLAAGLAELGRKVLLIDLDMNHSATRHFGVSANSWLGAFEVLLGDEQPIDVILTTEDEPNLPENLHLIPSRRRLEGIDQALADRSKFTVTQDVLKAPIDSLKGLYDYVLLDTAPNATTPTIGAYKAAEWFVLSAMPNPFAIAGLSDALTDIQDAQRRGNPRLRLLGVVVSGVDKRTTLANSLSDYIDHTFSIDGNQKMRFRTTIGHSTVVGQTQKIGKTLYQTHPAHKITQQYRDLVIELESRLSDLTVGSDSNDALTHECVANG